MRMKILHGGGWITWTGALLIAGTLAGCGPLIVAEGGPRHHRRLVIVPTLGVPVRVAERRYYYYSGAYYRETPSGYVVAPAPQSGPVMVDVPNYDGTVTRATLHRKGSGYVGPQGEYYTSFPSLNQLKVMYGKPQ